MIFKKSFTLSEIMIAMAVLGIIVAACVPIIMSMTPNKNAIMIRKAYYTTEQIISELINDENYYPDGDLSNEDEVTVAGTNITAGGEQKFRCLFVSKLNLDNTTNDGINTLSNFCEKTSLDANSGDDLIYTNDGMVWNFVLCPSVNGWDDGCRIDMSTSHDIEHTGYDIGQDCDFNVGGWGTNACGAKLIHKIGKMAMFIDNIGNISLNGEGMNEGRQQNIRNILNGNTSLMGK